MSHHFIRASALFVVVLAVGGCGGSSRQDLHAAFASIQVDEARIAHASAALETAGGDDERSAARDEICAAAAHLEATAAPLDDQDARARSERANRTCSRASEGAAAP